MQKLLFIQTGGTIDKDYPKVTNGWAFEIADPAIDRILAKHDLPFEYEVVSLLKKDSQEILNEDRQNISEYISQANFQKIIITHGTDTMIETGQFLSTIQDKLIILTGAMRPERFANSDADFNLGMAVGAMSILEKGVFLAMSGRVMPIASVKRDLKTGFLEAV